jgi:two-component system phosphate regulon sensor histidine kinase PhoR
MADSKFHKSNFLYYIFAVFLLLIFVRWWVWTYQKNEIAFRDKKELYQLVIQSDQSETTLLLYQQSINELTAVYQKQKARIIGEGIFFFVILIFGIFRMVQFFKKEMEIAGQQSNFLLSITHELKSPLASAILNNQTLVKRKNLSDEKVDQLLQNSAEELNRLRTLVERLLLAAKMETSEIVQFKQEFDFSEVCHDIFEQYSAKDQMQHQMMSSIEAPIQIEGDKVLLETVVVNLLENALKYGYEKGSITLRLSQNEKWIELEVENEGPTISASEKGKIWQKFYRIGDEQTRSTQGTGLGLYIVKQIVTAHQGKVFVRDKNSGGVIFKMMFPRIMTLE